MRKDLLGLAVFTLCLTLSGCQSPSPGTPSPATARSSDPYDEAAMDFKPEPAVLRSDNPHTGPYYSGSCLSLGPDLKPLDPSPEKTIQLDTVDRLIDLAPGVKYDAWPVAGPVPGPFLP